MKYYPRILEAELRRISEQFPVTAVTGPRQSGKSTMLRSMFPSHHYITFDDAAVRLAAKQEPALFISGLSVPVIIDEAQYVPEILPYIKINVDSDRVNGRFILTGSQVFNLMAGITESLAGRVALFELLPFSLAEIGKMPKNQRDCYRQILQGFYPVPNTQETDLQTFYGSYLSTYIERDVRQIQNVKDISTFEIFMQILAGRAGGLLNVQQLARDCGISHATAVNWLSILEITRIIYLLRPWFRNSSKRLVKSPKLYFTDTGLLAFLLKYRDTETLLAGAAAGAIFENMMVIEAFKWKLNTHSAADLYFYRDSNGVEIDLLVNDGQLFSLYEIKSGANIRSEMASNLAFVSFDSVEGTKKYLLSFNEHSLPMGNGVQAIPWWKTEWGVK
jgi:predicted AAA+ superfamily ATPase